MKDVSGLWMVADGMGGHAGGDIASQLAVDSVVRRLQSLPEELTREAQEPEQQPSGERLIREALAGAHEDILDHARRHPHLTGMGTTFVLLWISTDPHPVATIAHVGDSRAYSLRGDTLTLLTRDHSWVEEQVRRGLLSPEQAEAHPSRHVLTRALGIEGSAEAEVTAHPLQPNDVILLCTDGLTKMLDDTRIGVTLGAARHSPELASRSLVDEALRLGGEDNVTVVVCAASS